MVKTCTKCKMEKSTDEFPWKKRSEGKRAGICKVCQREYGVKHYNKNKEYYLDKNKRNNPIILERNKRFVQKYLEGNPCVDCGEADIEVLQFDHIEMVGSKSLRVSSYMGHSLETLKKEIEKCEVRCGNCHIRRTRKQMGWFRTLTIKED